MLGSLYGGGRASLGLGGKLRTAATAVASRSSATRGAGAPLPALRAAIASGTAGEVSRVGSAVKSALRSVVARPTPAAHCCGNQ